MLKKSFNADIPGSISEFQAVMKEFMLKYKLYKILIRGKGLEFESFRTYAPDDDASNIDWKASKRSNSILVKQYRDERNLKIVFLIDTSDNMILSSSKKLKCEYASEVVAAFSHLIITSGDKAGYILFGDKVKKFVRPTGGRKHFAMFMSDISNPDFYGGPANLDNALEFALTYLNKNIQSVVIVSDFIHMDANIEKKMSLVGKKFETLALVVRDVLDTEMPEDFSQEVVFEDPATGQQLLVNPKFVKEFYNSYSKDKENKLKEICLQNRIDLIELKTKDKFVPVLSEFLKGRIRRK